MTQSPFCPPYAFLPPPQRGQTDTFLSYMQDGKIYRQSPEGPQEIGVTAKTHDALQADYDSIYARCQEYYDALVKAGIIVPEPTQEEILKQQAEQLKVQAEQLRQASQIIADGVRHQETLAGMIGELQNELATLKNGGAHEHRATPAQESAGPLAPVAADDQSGVGDNPRLPELPQRSAAGDSRPQSQPGGSGKRTALPAKRPGGRHA